MTPDLIVRVNVRTTTVNTSRRLPTPYTGKSSIDSSGVRSKRKELSMILVSVAHSCFSLCDQSSDIYTYLMSDLPVSALLLLGLRLHGQCPEESNPLGLVTDWTQYRLSIEQQYWLVVV